MSTAQKILDKDTHRIIERVSTLTPGFYKHYSLDLDALCEHLGVNLMEAKFEDPNASGAITREGDKWTIIVNELHPTTRRRFTVAHELGHYFAVVNESLPAVEYLEDNDNVIKDYLLLNRNEEVSDEVYQVERQANMIGAALLMPEDKVRALFEQRVSTSDMMKQFGVSEAALTYRLKSLGLVISEALG